MVSEHQPVEAEKKSNTTKLVIQMIIGGAIGFFSMLGLDYLVDLDNLFEVFSTTEIAALVVSLVYALLALIVLAISSNRKIFMLNQTNGETSETEFDEIKAMLFWSSICLLIYAAALALMALGSQNNAEQQIASFLGVVIAMVAQTAISAHLWKRYDELYRDVTKESCAAAFVVAEFILFIWVAAAIFGFNVTFEPLAVIVVITGIYWAASIWFITRRGMT